MPHCQVAVEGGRWVGGAMRRWGCRRIVKQRCLVRGGVGAVRGQRRCPSPASTVGGWQATDGAGEDGLLEVEERWRADGRRF
jgi:hypothetical protein